jgi:hypothetical protein
MLRLIQVVIALEASNKLDRCDMGEYPSDFSWPICSEFLTFGARW